VSFRNALADFRKKKFREFFRESSDAARKQAGWLQNEIKMDVKTVVTLGFPEGKTVQRIAHNVAVGVLSFMPERGQRRRDAY